MTSASVRRNLFQSQLTRRPTPTSSTSAETLRLDVDVLSDSEEIVVRDKHGEIDLGDPPTPVFDEAEDAGDDGREAESGYCLLFLCCIGIESFLCGWKAGGMVC